jgi:hypothetical protein
LAGEEPGGFGGRTYLDIRWQRQGIRFVSRVNPTKSIAQNVSIVKSAVPVFDRFTKYGTLNSENACIHRDIRNRYQAQEMRKDTLFISLRFE